MSRNKALPIVLLAVLAAVIVGGALRLYLSFDGGLGLWAKSDPSTAREWPVRFDVPAKVDPTYDRVILVTLDTLRADHVSGYGYARETTPFLDSMIESGVAFDRAIASVSHTAPSHATMLTGLAPAEHGVVLNGLSLPLEAKDAASMFDASGFQTAAFVNARFLAGVAVNFKKIGVQVAQGGRVVLAAISWLQREHASDRFFMWVHLYDPHHWKLADRTPQSELAELQEKDALERSDLYRYFERLHALKPQVPGQPFDLGWTVEVKGSHRLPTNSREDYLDFVDAYDAHILYSDRQLERLYKAVESLNLPGRTLWIVTSDHGEGLASHEVAGHGGRIYQEQLVVPMVFHASDGSLQKRRVDTMVQHVDLFPTLAEIVGADIEGFDRPMSGASLWPLIHSQPGWEERAAFSQRRPMMEIDPDAEAISSLQTVSFKYILHEPGPDEFFDLTVDPLELTNLAERASEERDRIRDLLETRLKQARELGQGMVRGSIPDKWAQELRDLGYVGEEN